MGNLTRDVEVRFSKNNVAIANISIATNNRRKNSEGDWVDEACFIDVKMFGKRAEAFANHHSKGQPAIFVGGRLAYESWEKNGEKRNRLVVHATEWEFVPSTRDTTASGQNAF